jgi:hypothetical protein
MTLRDCTLFVQVPRELLSDEHPSPIDTSTPTTTATSTTSSSNRRIRIVIADLDEKSQVSRGEYWQSLERELIKGGYYLGAGKQENQEDCDLTACDLSAVVQESRQNS